MKFVRIVQVEYSQPTVDPQPHDFEIDGVALTVRPRDPSETEVRRLLVTAEVSLDSRPGVDADGKIVITEDVARQAEKAIELLADLLAVTTFSTRKIFSAVPTAGFSHYDKLQYTRGEVEEWRDLRHQATHADQPDRRYVLCRDVRPVLQRVQFAAYDVLFNKSNWNVSDSARRDVWYPSGGILPDGQHAVMRVHSSVNLHADLLFDGFGAYPCDRGCRVRSYPPDWWLDASFPVKGESAVETVASL